MILLAAVQKRRDAADPSARRHVGHSIDGRTDGAHAFATPSSSAGRSARRASGTRSTTSVPQPGGEAGLLGERRRHRRQRALEPEVLERVRPQARGDPADVGRARARGLASASSSSRSSAGACAARLSIWSMIV
jgi:hypothetical protein